VYQTVRVLRTGGLRAELAQTLRTAYADGLLSDRTFSHRLELLLSRRVIEPSRLVGDLTLRSSTRRWKIRAERLARRIGAAVSGRRGEPSVVLALDWDGAHEQLLIGRDPECDVVLSNPTVSREHARLTFRDGRWILQDLDSTNGTVVNRDPIGRCELWPGDRIVIGEHELLID
jgi:FHA domain-containing protein